VTLTGPNVLISKNVPDFMSHRCAEDHLARKRYIQFRYWCNNRPRPDFRMSLNGPMCDKRSSEAGYTYGETSNPSISFSRHFLAIRVSPQSAFREVSHFAQCHSLTDRIGTSSTATKLRFEEQNRPN
jgi:hypothetical protein